MLNSEKIRLMTRLTVYEEGLGVKDGRTALVRWHGESARLSTAGIFLRIYSFRSMRTAWGPICVWQ